MTSRIGKELKKPSPCPKCLKMMELFKVDNRTGTKTVWIYACPPCDYVDPDILEEEIIKDLTSRNNKPK